jgi:hypothetical protein
MTGDPIGHDVDVGVCFGTKEVDRCTCGGDKAKCDFYPEKRKAKEHKQDGWKRAFLHTFLAGKG